MLSKLLSSLCLIAVFSAGATRWTIDAMAAGPTSLGLAGTLAAALCIGVVAMSVVWAVDAVRDEDA
jgi:hypothetical protein